MIKNVGYKFNFTGNFSTQQVCESLLSQIKNKYKDTNVELLDVSGNPSFKFTDLSTVIAYAPSFPLPTYSSKFDKSIEYKFNVKETNIKNLRVTHHDFLENINLDITVKNNTTQQEVAVVQTIPAGHYTTEQFVTKIANFINETAKLIGVNNAQVHCWNGKNSQKAVYGGAGIQWTLKPQHEKDY